MNLSKGSIGRIIGPDTVNEQKNPLWSQVNKFLFESPKTAKAYYALKLKENSSNRSS